MRDACLYQQSFTKDFRISWLENEEILKTVEKIIIGDIKCRGNIQREDIYDFAMGKNVTDSIISSFLNALDIDAVCPLFFTCLLNKERVTISINYIINNPNIMKKSIDLFCST